MGRVQVVVGAVVRDAGGRVLAARRVTPDGWEFPGGKVEAGETEPAALARELREELGVEVEVGVRVGPEAPVPGGYVLRVWTARLTAGEPAPLEHAELRWLAPEDLDTVDWLPADRPVVATLQGTGRPSAPGPPGTPERRVRDTGPVRKEPVRYLVAVLVAVLGVAAFGYGGSDDSPGLQGIGALLVLGAVVLGVRTARAS